MRIALSILLFVSTTQPVSLEIARKVVQSEFEDLFRLNTARRNQNINPPFITGDFDGDRKIDLAVLVSVQPERLNPKSSFPTLTITKVPGKGVSAAEAKSAELSVSELTQNFRESIVLLIIHDFAATGAIARRFALLDFCNNGEIKMTASRRPLKTATAGDSPRIAPPRLRGDSLFFLDGKGEGTVVYWNGARYLWYPVE
jgi:hypothetical protein